MPLPYRLPVALLFLSSAYASSVVDPSAVSNLIDLNFTFGLPSDAQSVQPQAPASSCSGLGTGQCGPGGVQANFLFETFGPAAAGTLQISLFDFASASAPPPDLSVYTSERFGSFLFKNYDPDNAVTITLSWSAAWALSAQGNSSSASITASYSLEDCGAADLPFANCGLTVVPTTQLFADSLVNDSSRTGAQSGTITVNLAANDSIALDITDPVMAVAQIPEPSTTMLSGFGLLLLAVLSRRVGIEHRYKRPT
jgi:hypothetical protein